MSRFPPFPSNNSTGGYLSAESSSTILLYAAHRERVKKAAPEPIEAYAWVLPEFAPLACTDFPQATELSLVSQTGVSLLHFNKDSCVPVHVSAIACPTEEIEEAMETLRSNAPDLGPEAGAFVFNPNRQH